MWWLVMLLLVCSADAGTYDRLPPEFEQAVRQLSHLDDVSDSPGPKLIFYHGYKSSDTYGFKNASLILSNPNFNISMKTVIYVHGFIDGAFSEHIKAIVKAYLERGEHNILILDWHEDARPEYYLNAVPNVKIVGRKAATAVRKMANAGLDLDTLHLVGHSLGGQMVGVIGREIKRKSQGRQVIKRITGLDPALPGFYSLPSTEHISRKDGEYVDIIHTDAGTLGALDSTGTVDFWPNGGGVAQPGCKSFIEPPIDLCSHSRSFQFWAESIAHKYNNKFNAVAAKSWNDFKNGNVKELNSNVVMGIDIPPGLSGNYYLQTNFKSPFARGKKGVTYNKRLDTFQKGLFRI